MPRSQCSYAVNSDITHTTLALDAADTCYSLLEQHELGNSTFATWPVLHNVGGRSSPQLSHVVSNLYHGIAGIAVFLAYYERLRGSASRGGLARRAGETLLAMSKEPQFRPTTPGAYEGVGGVSYALMHVGGLLGRRDMLERAHVCATDACDSVLETEWAEISCGSAGVLAVATALVQSPEPTDMLRHNIERLVAHIQRLARAAECGVYWPSSVPTAAAGL